MNVIILDIDGVLNTSRFQKIQVKNGECDWPESQFNFDPICMNNLKEIVEQFDAYIVISSTWRYGCQQQDRYWIELLGNMKRYGLQNRVIDITPNLEQKYKSMLCRGHEIKAWINCHENVDKFVIIDDEDDMFDVIDHLAECDSDYGLTNEVKKQCYEILSKI